MKKYSFFIGIDVSKNKLDVCFMTESKAKPDKHMIVSNNTKGMSQILIVANGMGFNIEQSMFCFENTGVYSMPLACFLSAHKADYWIVPAIEIKRSKGITRGKTDKTD